MKIDQAKPDFKPVTITIENEEEALALLAHMAVCCDIVFEDTDITFNHEVSEGMYYKLEEALAYSFTVKLRF